MIFGAAGRRERQEHLAQIQQLLLHRAVHPQRDALRRLRQFTFRVFDDQVGHAEIALDGGLCLRVVGRIPFGVQRDGSEFVRRQRRSEERLEGGLAEVGGAEIDFAALFAEIEFARGLQRVLCLIGCRQREQQLPQSNQVLLHRGVELNIGAQR